MRAPLSTFVALAFAGLLSACSFGAEEEEEKFGIGKKQRMAVLEKAGLKSLEAGKWDSKLVVRDIDLPGLASSKKETIIARIENQGSRSRCIAPEHAKDLSANFFAKDGDDCRYEKFQIEDGKADIILNCGLETVTGIEMEMSGPVSRDSYKLDSKITLRLPMIGRVEAEGVLESSWVGACEKK